MSQDHPHSDRPRGSLSTREGEVLAEVVADLGASGAPMVEGLRAASGEAPTRRLSGELLWIASEMDRGQPIEAVMVRRTGRGSKYLGGLVQAATRSGRLGEAMVELVDHQRTVREQWRAITSSLAYSALLMTLALAIAVGAILFLIHPFVALFEEFQLELTYLTQILVWLHRDGMWWQLGCGAVVIAAVLVFRLVAGAAWWRRALATVPLIGMMWHWSGVSELARLLAVLIEQNVPLPEALRLAADGVHDTNVGEVSRAFADGVENGQPLAELLESTYRLPATLAPIVRWGERTGELAQAFRLASEMYEGRVRLRCELVKSIVPPLVFVFVATLTCVFLVGLYLPLINMIQGLW